MRILTVLLILALFGSTMPPGAWAASEPLAPARDAAAAAPNTRVYRITLEQYRQIEPLLREKAPHAAILLAQAPEPGANPLPATTNQLPAATSTNGAATNQVSGLNPSAPPSPPPGGIGPRPPAPFMAPHSSLEDGRACDGCDGFFNLLADLGQADWGNNDFAVVVFVVIGVVTVLAVVIYAGAFLYQAAAGNPDYTYWWDLEPQATALFGGDASGYMAGIRLSSGIENPDARVGLVTEVGYLDASARLAEDGQRVDIAGAFGLAGAGIRWRCGGLDRNPSFFGLELLGGTASDESVQLMSTARATLALGLGTAMRLGVSLGALYFGLEPPDSPAEHFDNFTTLAGIQAGYRF